MIINEIILNQLPNYSCGLNLFCANFVICCLSIYYKWFNIGLCGLNYIGSSRDLCGLICPPIGGLLTLNHMIKPNRKKGTTPCR